MKGLLPCKAHSRSRPTSVSVLSFQHGAAHTRKIPVKGPETNGSELAKSAGTELAKKNPFLEKTVYHDNFIDRAFIKLFTQKCADQLPAYKLPKDVVYDDFVNVSLEIMKGRSSFQQRIVVSNVLNSFLPKQTPAMFRMLFPPSKLAAEINAWFASIGFAWLVGESELREADVVVGPGEVRKQRSTVHIKKCRYLEASGCVGMCVNMCKVPTQDFFTNEFGLPLTMNPNFEDLSCDMIFGQPPPAVELDAVYAQPCFAAICDMGDVELKPCPKVDTERHKKSAVGNIVPLTSVDLN